MHNTSTHNIPQIANVEKSTATLAGLVNKFKNKTLSDSEITEIIAANCNLLMHLGTLYDVRF